MDGCEHNSDGTESESPTSLLTDADENETRAIWSKRIEFEFDLHAATNGRYTYLRELGFGGMARIMLARDRELEREVAVKVLETPVEQQSDANALRFLHEAKITANLDHPGIVPVYDLGHTQNGQHFFIMRVVDGVTLRELLDRANLDDGRRLSHVSHLIGLFLRVCQAVGYAHHKHIIHLDLKPMNIMEGPFGEVLVMDWGVAKRLEELAAEVTAEPRAADAEDQRESEACSPRVVGTPGFMAPEQYRGNPALLGPQTDVFALGVILFEILTAEKPFVGNSFNEIHMAVCSGTPAAVQTAARRGGQRRVPYELQAICEKALAPEPSLRYASARELADDIQAFLENRAVTAFHETVAGRLRRWFRRNRAASAALLTATCTAAFAVAFWTSTYISRQRYLHEFRMQVETRRSDYMDLSRKAFLLRRQLGSLEKNESERRQKLLLEIRKNQTRRHLAAQHLRSAIAAMLAAQRNRVNPRLCREFRELWLQEMELAMRQGFVEFVRGAFKRMREERLKLPWWDWEPDEFSRLDRVQQWLRKHESKSRHDPAQPPPGLDDHEPVP